MLQLYLSFLGSFHITLDETPVNTFESRKVRALLVYLAVECERSHRRDGLASLLWPARSRRTGRANLRQALSNLRTAIGDRAASPPFLRITRQTIRFNSDSTAGVDVHEFLAYIDVVRRHEHDGPTVCERCAERLRRAAELYTGAFLAGFSLDEAPAFADWLLHERERLHRQALDVLTQLATYHEQRAEYGPAHRYAQRQLALEPWREQAHRQLMRILSRSGQRSTALAQYEQCRRLLADELGVEPGAATTRLYEQIRRGAWAPQRRQAGEQRGSSMEEQPEPTREDPPTSTHRNLPVQLTAFVGRDEECAQVVERLQDPNYRLITIAGPGGIGKTRLALQAAHAVDGFRDGVSFVPLVDVTSTEQFIFAIVTAVGLVLPTGSDPRERLLGYLRERDLLLVLDNLEHLIAEVGELLVTMLRETRRLTLLVTSRERLNLQAESLLPLRGLPYPTDPPEQLTAASDYAAVELFLERAGRARMDFNPTPEDLHAVVRVCRLVEGHPLGIELAAAGIVKQSCPAIAQSLTTTLDVLATTMQDVPARHRSIRAVLAQSWQLLPADAQAVLARLSVFRGGFCADAAAEVAGAKASPLKTLVDVSLLHQTSTGRYSLHPLVRRYAEERLQADSEQHLNVHRRHAEYFARCMRRHEEVLTGPDQKAALAEIRDELGNLRASWRCAVKRGWHDCVETMVHAVYLYFYKRGNYREGVQLLERGVRRETDSIPEPLRGALLARVGYLYHRLGRNETAEGLLEDALTIARRHDDVEETAFVLHSLGDVAEAVGATGTARRYSEESITIAKQVGATSCVAAGLNVRAKIALAEGDWAEARHLLERCLVLRKEIGDQEAIGTTLNNLGCTAYCMGAREEARQFFAESLTLRRKAGDRHGTGVVLHNLAELAFDEGNYTEAHRLMSDAIEIRRSAGDRAGMALSLGKLAEILLALSRDDDAERLIRRALAIADECRATPVRLGVLLTQARLLMKRTQGEQAVELLTFIRNHPAAEQNVKDKAARILKDFEPARRPAV